MKNFDWNGFKHGKIRVECPSKEVTIDFLKECEKNGFLWSSGHKPTHTIPLTDEPIFIYADFAKYLSYTSRNKEGYDYTIWTIETESCKSTYTWREVFTNIQEGETYECGGKPISYKDGILFIGDGVGVTVLTDENLFTKQQEVRQVDFQEAQVALEEGKIVKSDWTGFYYKLHNDRLKRSFDDEFDYWEVTDLSYHEIADKWFIIEN